MILHNELQQLTEECWDALEGIVSKYEVSYHKGHANTNDRLFRKEGGKLLVFTKKKLEKHLAGITRPLFFVPDNRNTVLPICIDIDAPDNVSIGEADYCVSSILKLVKSIVPVEYSIFTSTNGKGIHLFLWVDKGVANPSGNDTIRIIGNALQSEINARIKEAGLGGRVDLRGIPTATNDKGKTTRGKLIRLPIFKDTSELHTFIFSKPVFIDDLFKVSSELSQTLVKTNTYSCSSKVDNYIYVTSDQLVHNCLGDCAWERMKKAGFSISKKLNRPATVNEVLEHYESLELNNRNYRHEARLRRAEQVVEYINKHFKPLEGCEVGTEFNEVFSFEQALEIAGEINRETIKDKKNEANCKRAIKSEDIAVILYATTNYTMNKNGDRKHCVGHEAIKTTYKVLKNRGKIKVSYHCQKTKVIRELLISERLIELVNENYTPARFALDDGRGIPQRWGLGKKHPMHKEEALELPVEASEPKPVVADHQTHKPTESILETLSAAPVPSAEPVPEPVLSTAESESAPEPEPVLSTAESESAPEPQPQLVSAWGDDDDVDFDTAENFKI